MAISLEDGTVWDQPPFISERLWPHFRSRRCLTDGACAAQGQSHSATSSGNEACAVWRRASNGRRHSRIGFDTMPVHCHHLFFPAPALSVVSLARWETLLPKIPSPKLRGLVPPMCAPRWVALDLDMLYRTRRRRTHADQAKMPRSLRPRSCSCSCSCMRARIKRIPKCPWQFRHMLISRRYSRPEWVGVPSPCR
jgi:hypothetical protein